MITAMLNQICTYWEPDLTQPDGLGSYAWKSPITLKCRWQDKQQMIRNKAGQESVSSSVVYLDREIELSGRLMLGQSTDLTPPEIAKEPQGRSSMTGFDGVVYGWAVYL